jgi:2-(1,2-epoxy-1,2-dihydrophenyl)acetyl-CoA isomerase
MSRYEYVLVHQEDAIATITLNRPDKLNAFAGRMRQEVAEAVREVADDDSVRVLVITGAGRAFCAGADIAYMRELFEQEDWENAAGLVEAGRDVVSAIRSVAKPVIASVNGAAAGGGANLALACDVRIASERATIGETFNRIGVHPDWGGIYFLPRLVGESKALELVFSGEMIDAREAERMGLFSRVVPHEGLGEETAAYARMLAAQPPIALALAKKAIYRSGSMDLPDVLQMELEHQMLCFKSEDAKEGMRAFLEKRSPNFRGA